MKFYSWNMYHNNPELDRAFDFISNLDFDTLCLQEVPEHFLERLKTLPFHIAYSPDVDRIGIGTEHNFCVILSRHPMITSEGFPFPVLTWPLRTRAFVTFMYPWGWRRIGNRGSLYADVMLPEIGRTRVLCLHLTLSYPARLLREFDLAASYRRASIPSVFCGDLNIIESFRVTLTNWLLGGLLRDVFNKNQSRTEAEKRFAELGLKNPLRGKSTHSFAKSQLDHILVPNSFKITKAEVLQDRVGSDHNPVFVEVSA
jgi:endonuclease/exonuclease/phosphatase family metal-dependent hydrolase